MSNVIITFGYDHRNPLTDESLDQCYVETPYTDPEKARAWIYTRTGRNWSFVYISPDEAGVDRYGLRKMDASKWPVLPESALDKDVWMWIARVLAS
jgi:hypothetical protein